MPNLWLEHVKKVRNANKGKTLKEILKMAKKSYKKKPGVKKQKHLKTRRKLRRKKGVGKRRRSGKK